MMTVSPELSKRLKDAGVEFPECEKVWIKAIGTGEDMLDTTLYSYAFKTGVPVPYLHDLMQTKEAKRLRVAFSIPRDPFSYQVSWERGTRDEDEFPEWEHRPEKTWDWCRFKDFQSTLDHLAILICEEAERGKG